MREWLSGGVSPCQGEGRGFESRLALETGLFQFFLFISLYNEALSPNGKALDSDSSISRFESW